MKPFESLTSVAMQTESMGWALSTDQDSIQKLYRTNDGGVRWNKITPPFAVAHRLVSAFFLDAHRGWASSAGDDSPLHAFVWRTGDGGKTWQSGVLPIPYEFVMSSSGGGAVSFIDARYGWALLYEFGGLHQYSSAIFGTRDGGQTWTFLSSEIATDMAFWDRSHGWISFFGNAVDPPPPPVKLTSDGGRTWADLALPPPRTAAGFGANARVDFSPASGAGLLANWGVGAGAQVQLYTTTDAGKTWSPTNPTLATRVSNLVGAKAVWVAVTDSNDVLTGLSRTLDAGHTWTAIPLDKTLAEAVSRKLFIDELWFVNDKTGFALLRDADNGMQLVKTSTGGASWSIVPSTLG